MQGKNKQLCRYLAKAILADIAKKHSALILGPRQAGKTTLVNECLKHVKNKAEYPLQDPSLRIELERDPSRLIKQIRALENKPYVFIDEAQKIPLLFDAVQALIDAGDAQFMLTGSSARKLKRHGVNLLPGRIKRYYLSPVIVGRAGVYKGMRDKNAFPEKH